MLTVARKRLRHHLGAFLVLTVTAIVSLVVLGVLQLLGGIVTDAAARTTVQAGDRAGRTIAVGGSIPLERLDAARPPLPRRRRINRARPPPRSSRPSRGGSRAAPAPTAPG